MNMQSLMAQAQKMQREITKKKEEIDKSTFEGKSEWLTVVVNGKKIIKSVNLNYSGTIDTDDKEMLEDMIKIAVNNACNLVDKEIEDKMGNYGSLGGLF